MIAVIIILAVTIAFQQVFWSRQVHKLVDKLMSRSYAEYVQATKPLPAVNRIQTPEEREDLGALQGIHV